MTGRPTTYAEHGMVATPHYLASQVGLRVLQEGGNAVDAAVAANATLNVVLSQQCHIGGDLFAMIWDPTRDELTGLNASGPAPAKASIDQLRSLGHESVPQRGALAVTVPGTVAGWSALLDRYGTRELGTLLEPAARYADDGFPVSAKFVAAVDLLHPLLEQDAGARDVFLKNRPRRAGDRLRQPQLAATFRQIGEQGKVGFYTGPVAEDIVSTLQAGGSAMSIDDLASFEPEWVTPLRVPYRGYELAELPANTQGPAALLLANIASGWPITELGHTTAQGVHAYVEAKKRVFAERDRYLADQRFVDVPTERFTAPEYGEQHRAAINMASVEGGPGAPEEDGDTVYFCVVDGDGLAVSMIQSVYHGFGSGIVAPNSGVLLHNRGFSFSLDPEHANALVGGKRPRHTLIPAMLLENGVPKVVFGAMGADGQAQTHLQLLLGLVDFGLAPQEAIETPRWFSINDEAGEPVLLIEPRVGDDTINGLRERGHRVEVGPVWDQRMGHAQMIEIDRERGVLGGAADPRGDGAAVGW